eukprot:s1692_g10.t2
MGDEKACGSDVPGRQGRLGRCLKSAPSSGDDAKSTPRKKRTRTAVPAVPAAVSRFRQMLPSAHALLRWPLFVVACVLITVVLVLYFAIRAAIHASEWLCAPASTRRARSWMLRAATAREYQAAALEMDRANNLEDWKGRPQSRYYAWEVLSSGLVELTELLERQDWPKLLRSLQKCLQDVNYAGHLNETLYAKSFTGTKHVIEDYCDAVVKCLNELRREVKHRKDQESDVENDALLAQSQRFTELAVVTFGRTALCLSGGGGMAFQHFGVIEELLRRGCAAADASMGKLTDSEPRPVSSPGGEQFDLTFSDKDTVLMLKKQLKAAESSVQSPVAGMQFLHGTEICCDDWILADHGIVDGDHLTLLLQTGVPSGHYKFRSKGCGPAGNNTFATVDVHFGDLTAQEPNKKWRRGKTTSDATSEFQLSIMEDEITSATSGDEDVWDPYELKEKWSHDYMGTLSMGTGFQFQMLISSWNRRGVFPESPLPDDPFEGTVVEEEDTQYLRLRLPFAAGWANGGVAGWKSIALLMVKLLRRFTARWSKVRPLGTLKKTGPIFFWITTGMGKQLALRQGLLPKIISGTSGGAAIAAYVCCRTDRELLGQSEAGSAGCAKYPLRLDPDEVQPSITLWAGSWLDRIRHYLRHGCVFPREPIERWAETWALGDTTFLEAFRRTGRVLNITVSTVAGDSGEQVPLLLNYQTHPHVLIASAVICSGSMPGLLNPSKLLQKCPETGLIRAHCERQTCYADGSIDFDIPSLTLAQAFGVRYTVAVQVNPHVTPFNFALHGEAGRPISWSSPSGRGRWRGGFILCALEVVLKESFRSAWKVMGLLQLLPRYFGCKWDLFFAQVYEGSVTLSTDDGYFWKAFNALENPSPEAFRYWWREGRLMVWQKMPLLEKRLRTEQALFRLEHELEEDRLPEPCQVGRALSLRRRSSCLHHSVSSPVLMET